MVFPSDNVPDRIDRNNMELGEKHDMRTLPENVREAVLLLAVAKGDLAFISCCLQNYVYSRKWDDKK